MTFVSQDVLQRLLAQDPCPLAVIYWALDRVTPREALHLLPGVPQETRLLVLGRFAYIEAPPPGSAERRHGQPPGAQPSLRLADTWTEPAYVEALERRILQALDTASLSTSSQVVLSRTQMPRRSLEATCFSLEEKGILQIMARTAAELGTGGDFVVLRARQTAG